jgi:hypothetical protein
MIKIFKNLLGVILGWFNIGGSRGIKLGTESDDTMVVRKWLGIFNKLKKYTTGRALEIQGTNSDNDLITLFDMKARVVDVAYAFTVDADDKLTVQADYGLAAQSVGRYAICSNKASGSTFEIGRIYYCLKTSGSGVATIGSLSSASANYVLMPKEVASALTTETGEDIDGGQGGLVDKDGDKLTVDWLYVLEGNDWQKKCYASGLLPDGMYIIAVEFNHENHPTKYSVSEIPAYSTIIMTIVNVTEVWNQPTVIQVSAGVPQLIGNDMANEEIDLTTIGQYDKEEAIEGSPYDAKVLIGQQYGGASTGEATVYVIFKVGT